MEPEVQSNSSIFNRRGLFIAAGGGGVFLYFLFSSYKMQTLLEMIFVSNWYGVIFLIGVIAIIMAITIGIKALFTGRLRHPGTIRRILYLLVLAAPVVVIKSWYSHGVAEARNYFQHEIITPLHSAVAAGYCSREELKIKDRKTYDLLSAISGRNMDKESFDHLPYFVKRSKEVSVHFGRVESVGCMIRVGFGIPLNHLICKIGGVEVPDPDSSGHYCDSRPDRSVRYFWSENKGGTAGQGW